MFVNLDAERSSDKALDLYGNLTCVVCRSWGSDIILVWNQDVAHPNHSFATSGHGFVLHAVEDMGCVCDDMSLVYTGGHPNVRNPYTRVTLGRTFRWKSILSLSKIGTSLKNGSGKYKEKERHSVIHFTSASEQPYIVLNLSLSLGSPSYPQL